MTGQSEGLWGKNVAVGQGQPGKGQRFPSWVLKMRKHRLRMLEKEILEDDYDTEATTDSGNWSPPSSYFPPTVDKQDDVYDDDAAVVVTDRFKIEKSSFFHHFRKFPDMCWRLHEVCQTYGTIRTVRQDKDSLYRAFAFGYLENMVKHRHEAAAACHLIRSAQRNACLPKPLRAKFNAATDLAADFVTGLQYGDLFLDDIVELLNDCDKSDLIVFFLRWLSANQMVKEATRYQPILEYLGDEFYSYVTNTVEAPGDHGDPIQVMALTTATGISVRVEYVEGDVEAETAEEKSRRESEAQAPDWNPPFYMLSYYGHYDLLYKRNVAVDGPFKHI